MISTLYQKTFSVLMKRPFKLWGITLLSGVLLMAVHVGFIGIPAVGFCALLLLEASMSMIYLNSYRTGLEPKTAYLFAAFRKDRIWRVLGGMAWMQLWIFLWSLIPIVGIVFGVIRAYEYAFVPYILMTREDVQGLVVVYHVWPCRNCGRHGPPHASSRSSTTPRATVPGMPTGLQETCGR